MLGAVIDLQFCLDLLDTTYLKRVKYSYENSILFVEALGQQLPVNKPAKHSKDLLIRELDYAVIENLHRKRAESGLRPFDSTHIQICIRNPNCIKGFSLPRNEVQWAA